MCAGVLAGRPRHFAFSFVSPNRNKPLNLAAESESLMRVWITALQKAIKISSARVAAAMSANSSTSSSGANEKTDSSATTSASASSSAASATSSPSAPAVDPALAAVMPPSELAGLSVLSSGPVQPGVITTVDGVMHLEG
jgi:hypothetical protein